MKIAIASFQNEILITVIIPNFSTDRHNNIIIEQDLIERNKMISTAEKLLLIDSINNTYKPNVKLEKNVELLNNNCVGNICKREKKKYQLNQGTPNKTGGLLLLLTEKISQATLDHNCNSNTKTLKHRKT